MYYKQCDIIYFDSFGVEHVSKEIEKFIGHKNIKTSIFRIQSNNSIICGYFCIRFIDFMLAGKKLRVFFLLMILKKMVVWFWVILKMNEIDKTNLTDQIKFRLNEINKIENYFNSEINQRKLFS